MATKKIVLPQLNTPVDYTRHARDLLERHRTGNISPMDAIVELNKVLLTVKERSIAYDQFVPFSIIREYIDLGWVNPKYFNNESLADFNSYVYYRYKYPDDSKKIRPDSRINILNQKNILVRECIDAVYNQTLGWSLYNGEIPIEALLHSQAGRDFLKTQIFQIEHWRAWDINDPQSIAKALEVWPCALPIAAIFIHHYEEYDSVISLVNQVREMVRGTPQEQWLHQGIIVGQELYARFNITPGPLFEIDTQKDIEFQKRWESLRPVLSVMDDSTIEETFNNWIPLISTLYEEAVVALDVPEHQ